MRYVIPKQVCIPGDVRQSALKVSHRTESISVQQFRDVDMSNGTEIQTERRLSPLMAASPVVNGVQGVTETQSYVVVVVGKDAVETKCRRYKRSEEVVPRSHENAKVAVDSRFSILNDMEDELQNQEVSPEKMTTLPVQVPRVALGNVGQAGFRSAREWRVSKQWLLLIMLGSEVDAIRLLAQKGLSVKKQTELRLPSPHVLSEWIPTVPNSSAPRVASPHRTVTVIDPDEAVDKGLEGVPHGSSTCEEAVRSVLMNVDKENIVPQQ
ncbi:hypothetical protein V6N12_010924 [Hibiscus sabdariffa]|uniref:Uncharacterized protein n=1 Tax=Hibiscus sabdariffa TaxID=183260 RepID=A0ABR2ELI7_9ROSI